MSLGTSHPLFHVALLLNRVLIGLYLLLAGVGKIGGGVGNFVEKGFKPMQPPWLPDALGLPYGYALPFLEVIIGAMLIVGLLTRIASWATLLMILSFTIAITAQGNLTNHGPGPFSGNLIYITLLFLLGIVGGGRFSLDRLILKRKS